MPTNTSPNSPSPQTHSRQAREAAACLRALTDSFDTPPAAMAYFFNLFETLHVQRQPLPRDHRPVFGSTCIFAPIELFQAVGARSVRLCNGSYHFDQIGADFMPAKSCPMVKATLGMLSSSSPAPDFGDLHAIINPTSCDQKKKSAHIMESMGHTVYNLSLPNDKDGDANRTYWRHSLRAFAKWLEQATGNRLTASKLKSSIHTIRRAEAVYRELDAFRTDHPSVFLGSHAFLVAQAFYFDDLDSWISAVEALNLELAERRNQKINAAQRKAPRVLFTGSPPSFPGLKLPLLIEEAGAVIVADETCSGQRLLHDIPAIEAWNTGTMIDNLADKYLKPCTCPIFPSPHDRIRRIRTLIDQYKVDGVVYQALSGCQVYEMEQTAVAKAMQDDKVPMLYVETDYSPDDKGQLSTRVEAFLESIKTMKRKRK